MLKIRFQRVGRKHEPVFRLVVLDSHRSTKSGRVLEVLGSYDSRRGDKAVFNEDRIKHWLKEGSQTSDTVHNLLVSKKIIEGKKINALPRKSPLPKATEENSEKPSLEDDKAKVSHQAESQDVASVDAPKNEESPKTEVVENQPA